MHTATSCSGVIVNNKYVLSAAHCFCEIVDIPCDPNSPNKLPYLASEAVHLLLGVNGEKLNLTSLDFFLKHNQSVEKVMPHPSWEGYIKRANNTDLAIIKTRDNISFTSDISPICMPDSSRTETLY